MGKRFMWYSFLFACVIVGTQRVNQKDFKYHCHEEYIKPFLTFSIKHFGGVEEHGYRNHLILNFRAYSKADGKSYTKCWIYVKIQASLFPQYHLKRILPTLPNIFTAVSCIKFGEHITSHDMLAVIIFLHAIAKWRNCTVNVLRILRKNQSREGKQIFL